MRRPDSLDDVDGILVYADALMTRNDRHGNLIALQHAKKTKQAKSWLQKHATALLGPLAEIEHATKRPSSPPCALLRSPLLPRLEALTLEFIDDAIADLVIEDPKPLRHLKKLTMTTLQGSDVTPSRRKRLKAALPKLETKRD